MKKILFIADECETGGATKSMLKLIELLKEDKVNIIVLTPNKNGKVIEFCDLNNIECHYINFKKVSISLNANEKIKNYVKIMLLPFLFIRSLIINNIATYKINKIINLDDIEFIHTNIVRDEVGLLLNKKYHIKHIMHLREYGQEDFNCIYFRRNYYSILNKYVDSFIAISNSIKNSYINKGIDKNKIAVIYNGVEKNVNIKENYDLQENKLKIVIVGALSETKGQIQVIKAIYYLKIHYGDFFNLYLYGSGSNTYIKYLKQTISKLELENNIIFMGQCKDVTNKISKYDIAITPSKSEAFGRVTVEYMLAKVPVIASNTGANNEIIIDNEGGLLYKYDDINDLSKKIYKLYKDKKLRINTANYSYEYAMKNFLALHNEKKVKKLYEEVKNAKS